METLKGFARRTTQSLREMVSGNETSPEEAKMAEIAAKVKVMEAKGETICLKVIQAARLMEELGTTLKELGEEYRGVPDLPKESRDLAEDVCLVGTKLVETSQEHQKGLKDYGFELLRSFSKQCAQLREVEETRRHHQLEYDFFKSKVQDLRSSPQKDFTRLPRNEQILESWRVELWRVTERTKALSSQLYVDGRRAIDRSVLTTVQVLHSFVEIASTGFAQTFQSVHLPSYPIAPVLPPTALPPSPAAATGGAASGAPPGLQGYAVAPANPYATLSMPPSHNASLGNSTSGFSTAAAQPPSPLATAGSAASPGGSHSAYSSSAAALGVGGGAGYQPPPHNPADSLAGQSDASGGYQPPPV